MDTKNKRIWIKEEALSCQDLLISVLCHGRNTGINTNSCL